MSWAPTTALGTAVQGAAFSRTLEAATDPDGDAPTYSAQTALPAGLSFNPVTRVVSGTPTAVGTHSFTIRAATTGAPVDQTFALTVTSAWLGAGTAADPWRLASGALGSCLAYRGRDTNPTGQPWSSGSGAGQDGVYRLSVSGATVDAWCDQTTESGGWTLVVKVQLNTYDATHRVQGAVNPAALATPTLDATAKLTDAQINAIRGSYATSILRIEASTGERDYFRDGRAFDALGYANSNNTVYDTFAAASAGVGACAGSYNGTYHTGLVGWGCYNYFLYGDNPGFRVVNAGPGGRVWVR